VPRRLPAADRQSAVRPHSCHLYLEPLEDRLPTGVMLGLLGGQWSMVSAFWVQQPYSSGPVIAGAEQLSDTGRPDPASDEVTPGSLTLLPAKANTSVLATQNVREFSIPETKSAALPATDSFPFGLAVPADQDADAAVLKDLARLVATTAGHRDSAPIPGSPASSSMPPGVTGVAPSPNGDSVSSPAGGARQTNSLPSARGNVPSTPSPVTKVAPGHTTQALQNFGQIPLYFEPNEGQTAAQVQFLSPGNAYTLFLTGSAAVLAPHGPAAPATDSTAQPASSAGGTLQMQVVGANPKSQPVGVDELPGKVNYFIGNDPAQWHTDIPTYAKVEYPQIYDGINLVYYGNQQQLEYDFIVGPNANPAAINLSFSGAGQIRMDNQGDLVRQTSSGPLVQSKPVIYQDVNGVRQAIAGGYVLRGPQQVGFQVGAYDPAQPLVIDPVLAYSTYLGGSVQDLGNAIAVDSAGDVYVTGDTTSVNFPTANALMPTYGGGLSNAFVAELDPTGSTLLYSTYLGGEGYDRGNGIAIDATGNVYVVGRTNSLMFPITPGAFEDSFRGPEYDAFVSKLGPGGNQLEYSTYLGGDGNDSGIAIAVDANGNAFVTGGTASDDFPVTQTAYQEVNNGYNDAFITELNATGTDVLYSTLLGGSYTDRGDAIAVDANDFVYVAGHTNSPDFPTQNALQPNYGGGHFNGFVAKLNPQASGPDSLIYSTFLGGSVSDEALGIAVDSAGDVYVAGETSSPDFPVVNAMQPAYGGGSANAFVAEIDSTGTTLLWATYLGGSGDDGASGLALDANDNIYITGSTTSTDFPILNAIQSNLAGSSNAFVAELTPDGSTLVYSTYLGGSGAEDVYQNGASIGAIAVDAAGNAYVTGQTTSVDFPTVNPYQPALLGASNAFIAKIAN
jgi:hypothetical protein